jgi:hypothetical protein
MYALIHDSQLLLGPIQYNYRLINSDLEDLEIEKRVSPRDYQNVPITLDANTSTYLLPAVQNVPEYDSRFQGVGNFEWEIIKENGIPVRVEFNYVIGDKTLEQIKEEYKSLVKPIRQQKENKILTLTINNTEIEVSTDREERAQFVTKLVSCSNVENATHDYKFRNGAWSVIGCTEIQYILEQIDHEVQEAFDWEHTKLQEIDACTTGEEVYQVSLE